MIFSRGHQRYGEVVDPGDNLDTITVLWFENQEVYEDTYQTVLEMSPDERMSYFAALGFEGAYCKWQLVDDMMEELFDNEGLDSLSFVNEYYNLKAAIKDDLVCFNEENSNDATPYLTFSDEEAALLGNKLGYVAIGDKLISPAMLLPSYEFPPISDEFKKYTGAKVEVTNKSNGKTFHSSLQIGRKGYEIAYETKTWRTKFLFIKENYYATNYQGLIKFTGINGKIANYKFNHNGQKGGKNLIPDLFSTRIQVSLFSGSAYIEIINFKNSKGPATASKKVKIVFT